MNICLENQHINDIQIEHYIDNGCFCKFCSNKRREIYFKAKNGVTQFEKIIHTEVINEEKQNKNKKILEVLKKIETVKFNKKQYSIKIG
jgi:hypothetical protein